MAQWKTNDDFEVDLKEFSAIPVSSDEAYEEPPLPTIAQYTARMRQNNKSIFDTDDFNSNDDEEVTYIYSGRGRGLETKIFEPGKPISQPVSQPVNDEEAIILRKIKEETGFIGHNEIVESRYKKLYEDAKEPQTATLSSVQHKRNMASPSALYNSRENSQVVASEKFTDSAPSPQVPLSVMMQRAKKQHKNLKPKYESDNSGSDTAISDNGSPWNGKNKSQPSTTSSVRSNSSEKRWRRLSATESSGEESRTRRAGDYNYVDKVNENGNFRKKQIFDVESDIEFPPLGH